MFKSAEEKLEALIDASRAILAHDNFIDSAKAIFNICRETTGATSGYVALLSEDGSENEVVFLEAGGAPCTVDPELPMPIRGLRESSYLTHKAVYDNDFMNSRWVKFMPAGHMVLKNVMFAPLNISGKTVGLIGLGNKSGDFTDEDAEIANVFGELAAISLMKSRSIDMLKEKTESLEKALSEVKTLHSVLPVCSNCKEVRDDEGAWSKLEAYIEANSDTQFTHGICPDCLKKHYPEEYRNLVDNGEI